MAKIYRLRALFRDGSKRIDATKFDSQKKAREYAVKMMKAVPNIVMFDMSNPDYADIWQCCSHIKRTDEGNGFYWSAILPYAGWQRGSGHYINADGSISKRVYIHY